MKFITRWVMLVLFIFVPIFSVALSWEVQCPDISERGYFNVLTINLLFSEMQERDLRLDRIADYIKDCGDIDIILLQEVVGGPLSGTINSALDLRNRLVEGEDGIQYNLKYSLANGLPGLFTVGNAILSRCKIVFTISRTLPFVTEEPFNGFEIPLRRKVMMCRLKIPNFGKINVYNTHLCAFCDPEERFEQAQVLLDFIDVVEKCIWGRNPIILGGDFNIDLEVTEELNAYKLITDEYNGFVDTYASVGTCEIDSTYLAPSCCVDYNDPGCTFAVSEFNPYAINPFTGLRELPKRIDYIFEKDLIISQSVVVFRSGTDIDPWVSDHSGVLTSFELD